MKYFLIILFQTLGFIHVAKAQQQYVSGTIKNGTNPNSVILALKSNTTFTSSFSNIQLTIQVPNTISPQPAVTVLDAPLITYWSNLNNGSTPNNIVEENGFFNYTYNRNFSLSPNFTFTAGVEVNVLEIQFTNGTPGLTSDIRFGHLADGGTTSFSGFYIEMAGADYTNYTSMFYGPGSNNGGNISSYSFITLANVALPLNILSFNVSRKEDNALLNWSVENQTTLNSYFSIERSTNGIDYTDVDRLPVIHNGNTRAEYNFTDYSISSLKNNGFIYYRIKQYDIDGKFIYSEIRKLKMSSVEIFSVQPNPATTDCRLKLTVDQDQKIIIQVTDAAGKTVLTNATSARAGVNYFNINTANWSRGLYHVSIMNGKTKQVLTLVKE